MPTLKELASKNPTRLGDPVSLKAETSTTSPTPDDRPAVHAATDTSNPQNSYASASAPVTAPAPTESDISSVGAKEKRGETLKEKALRNPTMLGDPISLKAETSTRDPTEEDRGVRRGDGKGSKL